MKKERELTESEEFCEEYPTLTKVRARRLIEREHEGLSFAEFTAEHGEHEHYKTTDVFEWMGY